MAQTDRCPQADLRDEHGRVYFALDNRVARDALSGQMILFEEEGTAGFPAKPIIASSRGPADAEWPRERGLAGAIFEAHLAGMAFARTAFWWHDAGTRNPRSLRRDFWRKLRGAAVRVPFAEDLLAAYYCAFDRATPRHVQLTLIGAIAYFVVPADAIPDMLPALGFTDDAAVLATAIKLVADHIRPVHRDAARDKLAEFAARD